VEHARIADNLMKVIPPQDFAVLSPLPGTSKSFEISVLAGLPEKQRDIPALRQGDVGRTSINPSLPFQSPRFCASVGV
jgi:hypothetical protein